MKDIMPPPPPLVHNQFESVKELFNKYVVPTYARFDIAFTRGEGSYVWDVRGKRYLDLGGGIAVNCLGHANAEITEALIEQSQRLTHVSNLYYHEPQGRLAQNIVKHLAPGKVFFCNSGGEADEGLFKLARKFGHDEGRFEIITTHNSFHGRTLAGISATGQEKVKKGFEPMTPGFRHVPYNDVQAVRDAVSPATVAVLIEGIQGEGGVSAVDFSEAMLAVAHRRQSANSKPETRNPKFQQGDAQQLKFADKTFDVVTVGYGLRNLSSWETGLREMHRVAKPGGRLLVLDFGKPENAAWRAVYFGYLRLFVPVFGRCFCGDSATHSYIFESLQHFPAQRGVAEAMRRLGCCNVQIVNPLGGVMGINYGVKGD